jgi:TFIIF-interacting CTD phosphatase-like protein
MDNTLKHETKKKYIIFDLDETLISAISKEDEYDEQRHSKRYKIFKKRNEYEDMDGYYHVFSRPGLQKFLDFAFKNFNVCIWTAASKDYALFIIEKIILKNKNRKLDYIFFSYHCDISKKVKKGIKDLSVLWDLAKLPNYNENNVIIIDDNPDVKKTGYCIQVPEFIFTDENSENDKYFETLKNKLIEYKNTPDDKKFVNY